jgi:hypothetical protein
MNNRRKMEIRRNRRRKEQRRWVKEMKAFIQERAERDLEAFFSRDDVKIGAALDCRSVELTTTMELVPPTPRG